MAAKLDISRYIFVTRGRAMIGWCWRWTLAMSTRFCLSLKNCARCPLWRSALNIFDLWFKVRRGNEQGVVASLLRREGPRRWYGPSRRMALCSIMRATVQQVGRSGNNACVQPLGARSLWRCPRLHVVEKGGNIVDGQLRGDWRLLNALVDLMEESGVGLTFGMA